MIKMYVVTLILSIVFISVAFGQNTNTEETDDELKKNLVEAYAYIHSVLGEPCDYESYMEIMPAFWNDFFDFRTNPRHHEDVVFNLKFADVFVNFGDRLDKKEILMYENPLDDESSNFISKVVTKSEQKAKEKSRCFTGGLITCDENLNICVCMNNTESWTATTLVNDTTGEPMENPIPTAGAKGVACFVQLDNTCIFLSYLYGNHKFTCVGLRRCTDVGGRCI